MTSGTSHLDLMIKEYLIYRGFIQAAKEFDKDLKTDKDKGFRADLIVDHISSLVTSHDLNNLVEFWKYLDTRVFSRLDQVYHVSTKKLYFSILKYYIAYASANNKQDKVTEFFSVMAAELQELPDWQNWFILPFLKNPETNDMFKIYYNKQWQDRLMLSLFNYLSVIFQSMPTPALMETNKTSGAQSSKGESLKRKSKGLLKSSMDIVDDFYTLTQSIPMEEPNQDKSVNVKSFVAKGIAKVTGQSQNNRNKSKMLQTTAIVTSASVDQSKPSAPTQSSNTRPKKAIPTDPAEMRQELFARPSRSTAAPAQPVGQRPPVNVQSVRGTTPSVSNETVTVEGSKEQEMDVIRKIRSPSVDSEFTLFGTFIYHEHRSAVTHAKFSPTGHSVVSADIAGVIKIWTNDIDLTTVTSLLLKQPVQSVNWFGPNENMVVIGCESGQVRLYDVKLKKAVKDMHVISDTSFRRLSDLAVNETNELFSTAQLAYGNVSGVVSSWDINTGQLTMELAVDAVQSLKYCQSASMLLAGFTDGSLKLIDTRLGKITKDWKAHSGNVHTIELSNDHLSCYTMDSDNVVSQRDISSGKLLQSFTVHNKASGPFVFSDHPISSLTLTPRDKIFALNASNSHILTCHYNGALMYKLVDGDAVKDHSLGGHTTPVVTVDWAGGDTQTCLTADMLGNINLNRLIT